MLSCCTPAHARPWLACSADGRARLGARRRMSAVRLCAGTRTFAPVVRVSSRLQRNAKVTDGIAHSPFRPSRLRRWYCALSEKVATIARQSWPVFECQMVFPSCGIGRASSARGPSLCCCSRLRGGRQSKGRLQYSSGARRGGGTRAPEARSDGAARPLITRAETSTHDTLPLRLPRLLQALRIHRRCALLPPVPLSWWWGPAPETA